MYQCQTSHMTALTKIVIANKRNDQMTSIKLQKKNKKRTVHV